MHATPLIPAIRLTTRRRFAWLLWLAMLPPLAQAVAGWHAVSHVRLDSHELGGKQVLHLSDCDLCLTAVAVTGGAPAVKLTATTPFATPHALPRPSTVAACIAAHALSYRSRAPPSAFH